ncbi:MAG TPA: hypothetical protein VFE27_24280 [Acidobacteriaceae bacterium]|jgi:hypothetical protein|nr:hypothetical protein [Acidobacteriaceae bacterium]
MRFVWFKNSKRQFGPRERLLAQTIPAVLGFLLIAALSHAQTKINPNTQIAWPAGCQLYNVVTNSCVSAIGAGLPITGGTMTGPIDFSGSGTASTTLSNLGGAPLVSPAFTGTVDLTGAATQFSSSGFTNGHCLTAVVSGLVMTIGDAGAACGTGAGAAWGSITGTLSSQTDLATALGLKAPLASPVFTGTLDASGAAVRLPSSGFTNGHCINALLTGGYMTLADAGAACGTGSGAAWGSITGTLSSQTDLNTALGLKAPLASPALTGTPTTPTASPGTGGTGISSQAYADASAAAAIAGAVIKAPTASQTVSYTDSPAVFLSDDPNLGQTHQGNLVGAPQPQNFYTLNSTLNAIGNMQSGSGNSPSQLRVIPNGDSSALFHNFIIYCGLVSRLGAAGFDMNGSGSLQTSIGIPCGSGGGGMTTNSSTGTITKNNGTTVPYDFTRAPTGIVTNIATSSSVTYGSGGASIYANTFRVYYVKELLDGISSATPGTMTVVITSGASGACPAGCTIFSGSLSNASTIGAVTTTVQAVPDYYTMTVSASGGAIDVFGVGMYNTASNGIINVGGTARPGLSLPDSVSTPTAVVGPWFQAATGAPVQITAWSLSLNVVTFTAANTFVTGQKIMVGGLVTGAFMNGKDGAGNSGSVTVLSSGLSSSQFKANFTHADGSATENGNAFASDDYAVAAFEMKENGTSGGTGGCQQATTAAPTTFHDYSYWLGQYTSQWTTNNPLVDFEFTGSYDILNTGNNCPRVTNDQERQFSQASGYFYFDNYFNETSANMQARGQLDFSVHSNLNENLAHGLQLWNALGLNTVFGANANPVANTGTMTTDLYVGSSDPRSQGSGLCNPAVAGNCQNPLASVFHAYRTNADAQIDVTSLLNVWDYLHSQSYFCVQTASFSAPSGCKFVVGVNNVTAGSTSATAFDFEVNSSGATAKSGVKSTFNSASGGAQFYCNTANVGARCEWDLIVAGTQRWILGSGNGNTDLVFTDSTSNQKILDIPNNTAPYGTVAADATGFISGASTQSAGNVNLIAIVTPTQNTPTTATTGGTIAASTQVCYRITATNANGETLPGAQTCVTTGSGTSTNTATITWLQVRGATGYKVYGRTTGAELFMSTIGAGTTLTFTDTGSITPSGALPGANTTLGGYQLNANTVLPSTLTGFHGTAGTKVQLSDGTGASGNIAKFAADGSATDGGVAVTSIAPLYNTSGTIQASAHMVTGSGTLTAGSLTVTLTGASVFTSSSTYVCSPDDSTGINGIDVVYNSGSSVTFNGTGTDAIRFSCVGN